MEVAKTSRLPKPSGIKAPQIRMKPLGESKLLQNNLVGTTSIHLAPRRSNSVADLRTLRDKPRHISKLTTIQSARQPVIRSAPKRKVEKSDKSSDEVKPKVAKQAKIPDWDYKGRFNQLRERHVHLQEEHKKQSSRLLELEDVEKKYEEVNNQHEVLQKKFALMSNVNANLTDTNKQLKTKTFELEIALTSTTKDFEELKQKYEALLLQQKLNCEKMEKITEESSSLNNNLKKLKEEHTQLKTEYEKVVEEHNMLKNCYKQTCTDKENLAINLDKETKKNKEISDQLVCLKKDVYEGEVLRRKLHNMVQDLKGNIRVFCRVRPPVNSEEEQRLQCLISFVDEKSIEIRKSRESVSAISGKPTDLKAEFTLDRVFEPNSSQEEIFEDLSQLVQSALDGYDICVFAYGQTGSGKTYTMQGGETLNEAGMIPRTIDLVFDSISNLSRAGWTYEVKASFLEIYNENVHDLLNPNTAQNLEIRYNEGKGTSVTNLTIQPMNSAAELKRWMMEAHRNRAVAATDFNEHSSRSHAVTKIYLHGVNEDANIVYTGSINLVDLAGSESAKTSASERLVETKNINKSLSTLGSVMLALYNKDKHIPYRNSKLTYLLQSCLGGSSKTLMVVNISPFEDCHTESVNSLRFAAKVKEVKTCAKRNKTNFAASVTSVNLK